VITSVGHRLLNGDTVIVSDVGGNTAANGAFIVADSVPGTTFALAGSDGTHSGVYTSGGKWTGLPLPNIANSKDTLNIYWKLKGDDRDAGFQGALVTGPGVQKKGTVRVKQLGDDKLGILALNTKLTNPDGSDLPAGTYPFDFVGK
jgi:hypothetical protein